MLGLDIDVILTIVSQKKKKKKRKIKVERDWAPKGKETVALARSFLNFLPTIVSLDGSFLVAARKKKIFLPF